MNMLDLTSEIQIQTTRSGGKGGQNVNKVETAIIATLNIQASQILSSEQKNLVSHKLSNRINNRGELWVKAQVFRTQLENREEAIRKINGLIDLALKKKKSRIATRPSKKSIEKRQEEKKRSSEKKEGRKKLRPYNF